MKLRWSVYFRPFIARSVWQAAAVVGLAATTYASHASAQTALPSASKAGASSSIQAPPQRAASRSTARGAGRMELAARHPAPQPSLPASPFMRVYGQAGAPYGWTQFCQLFSSECAGASFEDQRFQATPERLAEIDIVNRMVNAAVEPATDEEIYGVSEFWTLPERRGDCEDYALLKRKILRERGWPISSLLMTVVRDEKGEGHAILTVRTAQGDFILDNKVNEVKTWHQTPYAFVMRQSYLNPSVWVSLDPRDSDEPMALAGVSAMQKRAHNVQRSR